MDVKLGKGYKFTLIIIFLLFLLTLVVGVMYFINNKDDRLSADNTSVDTSMEENEETVKGYLNESSKKIIYDEALQLINSAKIAYQDPTNSFTSNGLKSVCITLQYLFEHGYYEKGSVDKYLGSVLIEYDGNEFRYSAWLSNSKIGVVINNSSSYEDSTFELVNNLSDYKDSITYERYISCELTQYDIDK